MRLAVLPRRVLAPAPGAGVGHRLKRAASNPRGRARRTCAGHGLGPLLRGGPCRGHPPSSRVARLVGDRIGPCRSRRGASGGSCGSSKRSSQSGRRRCASIALPWWMVGWTTRCRTLRPRLRTFDRPTPTKAHRSPRPRRCACSTTGPRCTSARACSTPRRPGSCGASRSAMPRPTATSSAYCWTATTIGARRSNSTTRPGTRSGRQRRPWTPSASAAKRFTFQDPDFRTRSVKVQRDAALGVSPGLHALRRLDTEPLGLPAYDASFDLNRDFQRELFLDRPTNVLLVKFNYWLSL